MVLPAADAGSRILPGSRRGLHQVGVDDDAGRDQLGAEIGLVGIDQRCRHLAGGRVRVAQQPVIILELRYRDGIRNQNDVGLRTPGRKLGLQLVHDLGRAGAEQLDPDVGMRLAEGLDHLRHLVAGLRRVDQEATGRRGRSSAHHTNRHAHHDACRQQPGHQSPEYDHDASSQW